MRRLTYILTELGANLWLKGAVIVMIGIVVLCSVQFFQAYENYLANTQALRKNFGQDDSIRLIDYSAEDIPAKNISKIIEEGKALFGNEVYYYLQGGHFFAEADSFDFSDTSLAIRNEYGQEMIQPKLVLMNQSLMEKVDFPLASGQHLDDYDFASSGNGILLGSSYRESYQIGDDFLLQVFEEINDEGEIITKDCSYTVKGFLAEDYQLLDFWQGMTEEIVLNELIVMPLTEDLLQAEVPNLSVQLMGFFYLLPAEEEGRLNYLEAAESVKAIGERHGYRYLTFTNDRTNFNYIINMYRSVYQNQLYLLLIVLVFATIQTGAIVHFSFKKRQPVYETYFSIGSTKLEIFVILITSYLLLFAIALAFFQIVNQLVLKENWLMREMISGSLFYFSFYLFTVLLVLASHYFPLRKNLFSRKKESKK
jgi:hypothetical protein